LNSVNFWKTKLMAFLHDPPDKPIDIPRHKERAEAYLRRAGIDPEEYQRFEPACDHTAAAADRFPFPVPERLKSQFDGTRANDSPIKHPLGGSQLFFDTAFPSVDLAEARFQSCQPGAELEQLPAEDREWANFFLHWRRWARAVAEIDWRTLYLPADTRIPDHSIWTHISVVSALQGCVVGDKLRPAFLLFHLGPVQDFIAQARSTRDLWSGSYLLSWLTAHAIRTVTDTVGPDTVIFPALAGQPLFDLLHRDRLYEKLKYASGDGREDQTLWQRLGLDRRVAEILTPSLPNRFLALVPADQAEELARKAEEAVHAELEKIGQYCWAWLNREGLIVRDEWCTRFFGQIERFPKIAWQVCPWGEAPVREAIEAFKKLDPAAAENLEKVYRLATERIPVEDRGKRYFASDNGKEDLKNRGFCWSYDYALTESLLAARRRLRDFEPWNTDDHQFGAVKDSLSGLEEVIGDEDFWKDARELKPNLFRSADRLGAINLVKRIWHEAYLRSEWRLNLGSALRFESVPGVAAGRWRAKLLEEASKSEEIWNRLVQVREVLAERLDLTVTETTSEKEWLQRTDPGCLSPTEWRRAEEQDSEAAEKVLKALDRLYQPVAGKTVLKPPPVYVAVLALDGDEMGKWVSGERTPLLKDQLSKQALDYFDKLESKPSLEKLRRPLSPSYHLQFSEALANFGLYVTGPIVEHYGGQLIYTGGDDVLAMLPAETALECAEALRAGFRGARRLAELLPDCFEVLGENGGYVRLREALAKNGLPSWPLVVPGPRAECSAGVAIGHIHSPLQGLIRAARAAEHRAKTDLGRGACAVSLYKRSGEILEWGFKWESRALELCRIFRSLSIDGDQPLLSARFGYALRALLQPYAPPALGDRSVLEEVPGFPLHDVVERELQHVLSRQWQGDSRNDAHQEKKCQFRDRCLEYLEDLKSQQRPLVQDFSGLFDTVNFIMRGEP